MDVEYQGLTFSRPGHATVRIETDEGTVVYVDPWAKVLDGNPSDADVVFSTHDDRDHYDPDAIVAVATPDTTVAVFEALDASELEANVVELAPESEMTVAGIDVRTVPAHNRSDGPHLRPNGEPFHPKGTGVGLVLTVDGTTVYYPSDTDALVELEAIEADVVLPPIGGMATMDQHEAAALVRQIEPDLVLPIHYNTPQIDGLDADPKEFKKTVETDSDIEVALF